MHSAPVSRHVGNGLKADVTGKWRNGKTVTFFAHRFGALSDPITDRISKGANIKRAAPLGSCGPVLGTQSGALRRRSEFRLWACGLSSDQPLEAVEIGRVGSSVDHPVAIGA